MMEVDTDFDATTTIPTTPAQDQQFAACMQSIKTDRDGVYSVGGILGGEDCNTVIKNVWV